MKYESLAEMPTGMRRLVCPKLAQQAAAKMTVKAVATARAFFETEEEFQRYLILEDAAAEGIISDLRLYPEITMEEAHYDADRKRVAAVRRKASFSYKLSRWHSPPTCCRREDLDYWSALMLVMDEPIRVMEFVGTRRQTITNNPGICINVVLMGYRPREV